jgi:phosphoglycolate phosphatase
LKLVIFDCDGTLVDSQQMIVAAMQEAFAAHGIAVPPRKTLLSGVGLSLPQAFERLADGTPDFPVASMVERYKAAFQAMRAAEMHHLEPLYPGAADAVAALARRSDVVLGIATGKSRRGARMVLGRHGLLDHFVTIQTADDAPSKPDPGMVLAAMREAGAEPVDTVVVGDTAYDMAMARAAGVVGIGVSWGYHAAASLVEAGAYTVIERFDLLLPVLNHLWNSNRVEARATASVP